MPDDSHDPIDELADEFVSRIDAGESPSIDEYCDRHPELADQIRDLFSTLLLLQEAKPGSGPTNQSASSTPDRIGEYEIVREIGRGGMGVVYEANHAELGRSVALKVLPRRASIDPRALARFHREGRAIAKLHHTNIVPLFEVGDDDGQFFLVMQLISGQSLDKLVFRALQRNLDDAGHIEQSSRSSIETFLSDSINSSELSGSNTSVTRRHRAFQPVAKIGLQVADALAYSHARGIIHRDIKPSNILLDENGVAWLTDFGLAKVEGDDLTQTGDLIGTLKYIAPERFHGEGDERADIYGLGLTLYELLAMKPAYDATDRPELIHQISQSTPVQLRVRNPRVPRDLNTIVMKAIEKEPWSRYRSARAMADDLRRYMGDQPIKARRHSTVERVVRWTRRNKTVSVMLVALALAMGGLAYSLKTTNRALAETKTLAAQSFLMQADAAFNSGQFQSASILAAASYETNPSKTAASKLQSARASSPVRFLWASPTLRNTSAIASSSDGRYVAAATTTDAGIWVWDMESYEVSHRLESHREAIRSLSLCTHTNTLLSGSKDQSIRLWDLESGKPQWSQTVPTTPASVAIDSKGKLAAAGGIMNGTVWIWDCQSGQQVHRFEGNGSAVNAVAFDNEAKLLAAAFEDGTIRVWNLDSGTNQVLRGPGQANSLLFLADAQIVVTTDIGISLWTPSEVSSQYVEQRLPTGNDSEIRKVISICHNTKTNTIAVGTQDGSIRFWDTVTLRENVGERLQIGSPLSFVAFGRNDNHLIVGTHRKGQYSVDRSIRVVDRMTDKTIAWTEGHVDEVIQLAFDASQSRLISVSYDSTVRVWDANSGDPIARLAGHQGDVNSASINPTGSLIATGGADQTMRLWDSDSGREIWARNLGSPVVGVAFDPRGEVLVSTTREKLQFWEWKRDDSTLTCQPSETYKSIEHEKSKGRIQETTLCFSPDGEHIACGSKHGEVLVWSALAGDFVAAVPTGQDHPIFAVEFSADGTKIAAQCSGAGVAVLDVTNMKSASRIGYFGHPSMRSMDLSPAGDILVTGDFAQKVIVWSVGSGRQLSQVEGHRARVDALAFAPDGKRLASSSDAEVRMWDFNVSEQDTIHGSAIDGEDRDWDYYYDMLFSFDFTSDEKWMFIKGYWKGTEHASLLNRSTGAIRVLPNGYGGSFDPQDRWLALGKKTGELDLIEIESDRKIPLDHDGRPLKAVEFNCDGTLLAGAGRGKITVWDVQKREQRFTFPAHLKMWTFLSFHPTNPGILASSGDDGMIYLWDVTGDAPKRVQQLDGHHGSVRIIAFSRDGKRLASGSFSAYPNVLLWDLETGEVLKRFRGHNGKITAVDISPDGRFVASAAGDATVRMWDVEDETEVRQFQEHTDYVYFVKFSADGKQLITASRDGTIRFRDLIAGSRPRQVSRTKIETEASLRLLGSEIQPIVQRVRWRTSTSDQSL